MAPLLEVEQVGGVTVARFTCTRLRDEGTAEAARRQLEPLLGRGERPRLVLSFAGVDDLASAMLARLLGLRRKVRAAGGRLALCALGPHAREKFQTTQLDRLFSIYPDEAEALRRLSGTPAADEGPGGQA